MGDTYPIKFTWLNAVESRDFVKILYYGILFYYFLCNHYARETQIAERIIKLTPIYTSTIYQFLYKIYIIHLHIWKPPIMYLNAFYVQWSCIIEQI